MNKKYTTTLSTRAFLYNQSKLVSELIIEGFEREEVKATVLEDNLFHLKSEDRVESFCNEIYKRLNLLNQELLHEFNRSDTYNSKIILLYAILRRDRLFYEWMREIVWEKQRVLDYELSKNETRVFIEKKKEQSSYIQKWTDDTIERLINAYFQVLYEAGYGRFEENTFFLHYPFVEPRIRRKVLEHSEKQVAEVLFGEVIHEAYS